MKTQAPFRPLLPLLFSGVSIANLAVGQVMLSPVAVSTDIPTYSNPTILVTNMIDHSGVTTPFTNGVTVFDEYFVDPFHTYATSGNGGTNNWQSDFTFDPGIYQGHIDFDLGAVYQINKLAIWNKSLSNITVKVLSDLGGAEQVIGDFTLGNYQSYFYSYGAEILPFGAVHEGRYVRVEINSVYPVPGYSFGYSIVGEVVASVLPAETFAPVLSITKETNGDVTITFTGTLLTAPSLTGTFTNVLGDPPSPYTVPKADLLPQQFFRALGH